MPREYEIVPHSRLPFLNAFLVRLSERTPHIHRELELGMVLEDSVVLHINNADTLLEKGDLYLINSMESHAFFTQGKGALLLALQLSPSLFTPIFPEAAGIRYPAGANLRKSFGNQPEKYHQLCQDCILLAYHYLQGQSDSGFPCYSLCISMLTLLQENTPWQVLKKESYLPIKQRAERMLSIMDYIDENFQRKLLLGEIAQRENLSLTYLSHAFQNTLGMTFQGYLNQKRFEYACQLLTTTDRKILDISLSSGFSDVRYFNRMFQDRFGCSPKAYRRGGGSPSVRLQLLSNSTQDFFTPEHALTMLTAMLAI